MKFWRTKDATGKKLKFYKQHHTLAQLLFNDMKSRNGVNELLLDISELEAQITTELRWFRKAVQSVRYPRLRLSPIYVQAFPVQKYSRQTS